MTIEGIRTIETKDIALITILSYVVGFVITNIYLANFAFAEFSFFHVKFIPVGFLFLFLSLGVYFCFQYADLSYKERAWYVRIPLFLCVAGALIFFLDIVFVNRIDAVAGHGPDAIFKVDFGLWIVLNLVLYFIITALLDTKNILINNFKDIVNGYKVLNRIFFLVAITVFNIALFANLIYPSVPTYLGGGRQIMAAILVEGVQNQEPTFVRIIYQTPDYLLYESLAPSTDKVKVTMVPFDRIDSIEYLGIDAGTGSYIFSKYMLRAKTKIQYKKNK